MWRWGKGHEIMDGATTPPTKPASRTWVERVGARIRIHGVSTKNDGVFIVEPSGREHYRRLGGNKWRNMDLGVSRLRGLGSFQASLSTCRADASAAVPPRIRCHHSRAFRNDRASGHVLVFASGWGFVKTGFRLECYRTQFSERPVKRQASSCR